ncbi:MAG: PAS domain S-box protein [Sedimentisphaerales bacterium]|nr:PAS domain S-box protein [Sedimentisphaerales bacterium]
MLNLNIRDKRAKKMERRIGLAQKNKSISFHKPKVASFFGSTIFVLFLLFVVALLAMPAWRGWRSYTQLKIANQYLKKVVNMEGTYLYRDEALTMSLNMAAQTGDKVWIERYDGLEKRIRPVIEPGWGISENSNIAADTILTNLACDNLNELDEDILDLLKVRNYSYAKVLLKNAEYEDQKQTYNRGMKNFVVSIRKILEDRCDTKWKETQKAIVAIIILMPLIMISWLVINNAGKFLRKRADARRNSGAFGKQWQETFNAITDGICILDKDGDKIIECNKAMIKLFKRPQSEIIGHSCCELLHDSKEPVKKCPLAKMMNTKRSEEADLQVGDKWVNVKVEPLIDDKGNLTGAVHIISDITKHRKTHRALRESDSKFRLAFANAQDAIVWIEAETGNIINCNKAFEELFGQKKKDFDGQHYSNLFPEDKKDTCKKLETKSGQDMNNIIESEILAANSQLRYVTIATSAMQVEENEIVQWIVRDITESKKAIEEAKNLARFPGEDPNPVMRISTDSEILYANDSSAPVLETWKTQFGEKLSEPWCNRIDEVYNSGKGTTFELTCDDGHIFIITLQPITGSGYVNAYGLDITNNKKAEKEKMDLELQLSQKQKMEAIGTLAGGIAHDFNNILSALQGYTELSLDDLAVDHPVRDNLEQILTCTNRATKLVKQILTFSRKNEQEQEKQPVQISAIVKEVLGMLRSSLPTTIKICRKINAEKSKVHANPTQIHQVLLNLCTNASHAMGQNPGTLEVSLDDVCFESQTRIADEHLIEGSYVKLSVSDTGCGMEPEVLKRIFEPFFTTKNPNEGTGLGLPVVHGIVKSHGGAMDVTSTPGQGTTFEIYLPKLEADDSLESQEPEPKVRDKKVVLLVDDEDMIVNVTGQILERLGYEVVAETNSLDALEQFQEKPDEFDLVITDQVMPNMTGTELAEKMFAIRQNIPVILFSGYPERICHEELKRIGINHFIMKPINRQELTTIIQEILNPESVPV